MKLCVIDVIGAHYRLNIFRRISNVWETTWIFGKANNGINQLTDSSLSNIHFVKNITISGTPLYFQTKVISQLFKKDIGAFLVNGEPFCISTWGLLILRPIFARNKKIYLWSHGWYGREGNIKKWIKRLFSGLATGTFLYGNYAKNIATLQGNNPNKLWVIHNSLDYDTHVILRNSLQNSDIFRLHFKNPNPTLIFIGRLTRIKKLDFLIRAVAILRDKGLNFNIVFVGDGQERGQLQKLSNSLRVPTWFYGECHDEKQNAELIYNADLCVSPGNVGLTAIHALTFGTPVITHDDFTMQMPEFEAIKSGVTGSFFSRNNIESLAFEIQNWYDTHPDREKVRLECFREVDSLWNPAYQISILQNHITVDK